MPRSLQPPTVRVRLPMGATAAARAGAAAAGLVLVAAGAVVPFAALAPVPELAEATPAGAAAVLIAGVAAAALGWPGCLLLWSAASDTGRLTVSDEHVVVRHDAWLRAPLVLYRSQVGVVALEPPGRRRGLANLSWPGRPNLRIEFNEPKRIDGLRPLAWAVVARTARPAGISLRIEDPDAACDAFARWARAEPAPATAPQPPAGTDPSY